MKRLLAAGLLLGLAACASGPGSKSKAPVADGKAAAPSPAAPSPRRKSPYPPAQEDLSKRGHYTAGGLYAPHIKDSAPDVDIDVSLIPEPEVVSEARSAYGNRPTYAVLGKTYKVLDDTVDFVERGTASYYGNKFHGRRTSNMEVYDMFAFTAAHKSLPLPSFARITNLDNGQSVVVRVNDRGPFHDGRVVDLSYAAAVKLGIHPSGTGRVEVKALQPDTQASQMAAAPVISTPTTSMDSLVAKLPTPVAAARTPAAAPTATPAAASGEKAENWRFDMNRDGRTMTADDFDAWMAERKLVVINGRFHAATGANAGGATTAVPKAASAPTSTRASSATPAVVNTIPAPAAAGVVLQVASFTARDNADKALAILRGAGIDGANLHDGTANGRRVWRLRVGPLESSAATGLASRISGLGFGPPHRVTE